MASIWTYMFALFLAAHGYFTFATYVTPSPDAPFEATQSWLLELLAVPEDIQNALSMTLAGIAAVAFVSAALGVIGFAGLVSFRSRSTVAGAVVSLFLMGLYFDSFLSVGIAVNAGLLITILIFR
jgi:hypothetical protein